MLHRVYRVDDQIDEDLLELNIVRQYPQGCPREHTAQGDPAGMSQGRNQIDGFTDHPVEVDFLRLEGRALEQAAQAPDYLAGALIVAPDVGQNFLQFVDVERRRIHHQRGGLGVDEDGAQRLIELVCDRRGQFSRYGIAVDVRELRNALAYLQLRNLAAAAFMQQA